MTRLGLHYEEDNEKEELVPEADDVSHQNSMNIYIMSDGMQVYKPLTPNLSQFFPRIKPLQT